MTFECRLKLATFRSSRLLVAALRTAARLITLCAAASSQAFGLGIIHRLFNQEIPPPNDRFRSSALALDLAYNISFFGRQKSYTLYLIGIIYVSSPALALREHHVCSSLAS